MSVTLQQNRLDDPQQFRRDIAAYAQTDLLCYRAEESELQHLQDEQWEPVLKQVEAQYDLRFERTIGIMPVEQPQDTLDKVATEIDTWSDDELNRYGQLVLLLGSINLVLALKAELIDVEQAIACSQLDENWQAGKWGEDEEAQAAREQKAQSIREISNH